MVAAALREVFNAEDLKDARERSASVIERLAGTVPKVAALLEEAEEDLLAFYRFQPAHWSSCAPPTTSSASTRRSPVALTSSGYSPTTAR
ncbi:MAG TPA: transposase [Solirubrobacterales bacterium]